MSLHQANATGFPVLSKFSGTIADFVGQQEPEKYPFYYLYSGTGTRDSNAGASSSDDLTSKSPSIISENFSWQNNITCGNGNHNYESTQVALFNLLQMTFPAE